MKRDSPRRSFGMHISARSDRLPLGSVVLDCVERLLTMMRVLAVLSPLSPLFMYLYQLLSLAISPDMTRRWVARLIGLALIAIKCDKSSNPPKYLPTAFCKYSFLHALIIQCYNTFCCLACRLLAGFSSNRRPTITLLHCSCKLMNLFIKITILRFFHK